jgi:Fe-S-cluster containining protein
MSSDTDTIPVPCNGCRACCRHELVVVVPEAGDDPASYDTEVIQGLTVLRQRPNGDCIYLDNLGCTIHDRAPAICRRFDCRRYFLSMHRNERRAIARLNSAKEPLFEAARARLHTLTMAERDEAIRHRRPSHPITAQTAKWLKPKEATS